MWAAKLILYKIILLAFDPYTRKQTLQRDRGHYFLLKC